MDAAHRRRCAGRWVGTRRFLADNRRSAGVLLGLVLAGIAGTAAVGLLEGETSTAEWVILADLALAGALAALLLARLIRDAERVDRRNAELSERSEHAEQATEEKSGFIAALAHEMRTPIATVAMFADLMASDEDQPLEPEQRRRAADIGAAARHALRLLDETLDISRIEAGRLELRPERASVAAVGIEAVEALGPVALEHGIELSLEADGRIGEVFADRNRVRQVMTNYISNALKFTPTGGSVRMRLSSHGDDSFAIAVEDTGAGIAEEDIPRLFSPGFKPVRPAHPGEDSSGLGLAVTRRLTEAMGGTVEVSSVRGSGSTFVAVLPKVSAERRARAVG